MEPEEPALAEGLFLPYAGLLSCFLVLLLLKQLFKDVVRILRGLVGGISEIFDQLVDKDGVVDEDWSTTQAGLDFDLAVLDGR